MKTEKITTFLILSFILFFSFSCQNDFRGKRGENSNKDIENITTLKVPAEEKNTQVSLSLSGGNVFSETGKYYQCNCSENEQAFLLDEESTPVCALQGFNNYYEYLYEGARKVTCSSVQLSENPQSLSLYLAKVEIYDQSGTAVVSEETDKYLPLSETAELIDNYSIPDATAITRIVLTLGADNNLLLAGEDIPVDILNTDQKLEYSASIELESNVMNQLVLKLGPKTNAYLSSNRFKLNGKLALESLQRDTYTDTYQYVEADLMDKNGNPIMVKLPFSPEETKNLLKEIESTEPQFVEQNTKQPNLYYALIFAENYDQTRVLDILQVPHDFFPLMPSEEENDQSQLGTLNFNGYEEGVFVYAILTDHLVNVLTSYPVFRGYKILNEITYTEAAEAGLATVKFYDPTEEDLDYLDEVFTTAMEKGYQLPTDEQLGNSYDEADLSVENFALYQDINNYEVPEEVSTFNSSGLSEKAYGPQLPEINAKWSCCKSLFKRPGRSIFSGVRTAWGAVKNVTTHVFRGLSMITSGAQRFRVEGKGAVKDQYHGSDGLRTKNGKKYYLKQTKFSLRSKWFPLNGDPWTKSDNSGRFRSNSLASTFFGKKITYVVRVTLENKVATVYDSNPYWPVIVNIGEIRDSHAVRYWDFKNSPIVKAEFQGASKKAFIYGVVNMVNETAKGMFGYSPDRALIVTGTAANTYLSPSTSGMAPMGRIGLIPSLIGLPAHTFLLQADADIYYKYTQAHRIGLLAHEYGHFYLFDRLDSYNFGLTTKLLTKYLAAQLDGDGAEVYMDKPNMTRFEEGWAEFFAYSVLEKSYYHFSSGNDDMLAGYFKHSEPQGIERNFSNNNQFSPAQQTIGRVTSILYDLYDSNVDAENDSTTEDFTVYRDHISGSKKIFGSIYELHKYANNSTLDNLNIEFFGNRFGSRNEEVKNTEEVYRMHGYTFGFGSYGSDTFSMPISDIVYDSSAIVLLEPDTSNVTINALALPSPYPYTLLWDSTLASGTFLLTRFSSDPGNKTSIFQSEDVVATGEGEDQGGSWNNAPIELIKDQIPSEENYLYMSIYKDGIVYTRKLLTISTFNQDSKVVPGTLDIVLPEDYTSIPIDLSTASWPLEITWHTELAGNYRVIQNSSSSSSCNKDLYLLVSGANASGTANIGDTITTQILQEDISTTGRQYFSLCFDEKPSNSTNKDLEIQLRVIASDSSQPIVINEPTDPDNIEVDLYASQWPLEIEWQANVSGDYSIQKGSSCSLTNTLVSGNNASGTATAGDEINTEILSSDIATTGTHSLVVCLETPDSIVYSKPLTIHATSSTPPSISIHSYDDRYDSTINPSPSFNWELLNSYTTYNYKIVALQGTPCTASTPVVESGSISPSTTITSTVNATVYDELGFAYFYVCVNTPGGWLRKEANFERWNP